MKTLFLIFFILSSVSIVHTQDTTKILAEIEVKIKNADQQKDNNAKMAWIGAYTGKTENHLFPGLIFVGSALGNEMTSKKYKKLGNGTFMIPTFNSKNEMIGTIKDVGKIVQDQKDFDVLFKQIQKELGTDMRFRELNKKELFRCWQLLANKFDPPFFVVENNSSSKGYILIMTSDSQILFIDKSLPN
jgi:hypothetical protein